MADKNMVVGYLPDEKPSLGSQQESFISVGNIPGEVPPITFRLALTRIIRMPINSFTII